MNITDKKKDRKQKDPSEAYEEEYPENGDNFSAGNAGEEPMPNKPAENEERTSPEEDEARSRKKDKQ